MNSEPFAPVGVHQNVIVLIGLGEQVLEPWQGGFHGQVPVVDEQREHDVAPEGGEGELAEFAVFPQEEGEQLGVGQLGQGAQVGVARHQAGVFVVGQLNDGAALAESVLCRRNNP